MYFYVVMSQLVEMRGIVDAVIDGPTVVLSPEARNKTRIRKRDYKRKIKNADDDQQVKKVAKLIRTGKKFFKQACVQTSRLIYQ